MTDFKKQNSEEVAGAAKPSTQRRALIKGVAVAAPVVLTFRSGAAFAMTSNVAVCIPRDNVAALNKPPIITPPGADKWLRKSVFCKTLTPDSGGGTSFYVYNDRENASVGWKDENNIGVLGDATYHSFSKGTDPATLHLYIEDGVGTVGYNGTSAIPCEILIQVDENSNLNDPASFYLGNSVQISTSQGAGYPYVTGSCWGSVAPL